MERAGSCQVKLGVGDALQIYDEEKKKKPALTDGDGKEISEEKLKAMKDYAATLRRKFPHMKPDRIKRKVAEYFKIKLV
jgi:hypothetical protein